MAYSLSGKKVWVSGHLGMVGSALTKILSKKSNILYLKTREELDKINNYKPHQNVILIASGIHSSSMPTAFQRHSHNIPSVRRYGLDRWGPLSIFRLAACRSQSAPCHRLVAALRCAQLGKAYNRI